MSERVENTVPPNQFKTAPLIDTSLEGDANVLYTDPHFVMKDAYAEHVTPKTAQEARIKELDAMRDSDYKNMGIKTIVGPDGKVYADLSNWKYASSAVAYAPEQWQKTAMRIAQMSGITNVMTDPMWFSPLHTPQNWQIAAKRREVYNWCRFFYANEPKVAAAIDFYSQFPMNGFKLECSNRKIEKWFDHNVVRKLKINNFCKEVSSEYFTIGDVFIHRDIECPVCGGSAKDPETGEVCNHPGGTIGKLMILNPDYVEVQNVPLLNEPQYAYIPDEELKNVVQYRQPKAIYDALPDAVKIAVMTNKPIPLSKRTISHLKHMPVPYGTYGSSLIRRLFTTLAYKTKIMTANWIVAERLILPVRVVKIGSDARPAVTADIVDVQQQLAGVANDPNMTIVTHHNFEYEWYGASGKILQVTQELEHIDKEILDGMMLNEALLNGEGSGYQSGAVGVEALIRRIESWRDKLAEWLEEEVFKPIAQMQGFIDEEASKELGQTVWLYPTIKWNDLNLRDKSQLQDKLLALHDKMILSSRTLLESFGFNYDQEIKRLRYEQVAVGPQGGMLGGMQGGGGMMGGGGGGGMGGPGGAMGGPGMMPGMGGPGGGGGGGMGGPGGGAGGMDSMGIGPGMMPPTGPMAGGPKVMKKGKGNESAEDQIIPMVPVKLTGPEQDMAEMLVDVASVLRISPQMIRVQFPVENPTGGKPFPIDFAFPNLKVGVECDGKIWHDNPEQAAHDKERDQLLAMRGWTILRFDDKTIDEAPQAVKSVVSRYLTQAFEKQKDHKKEASASTAYYFTVYAGKLVEVYAAYDRKVAAQSQRG